MNIVLVLQHKLLLRIQRLLQGGPAPVQPLPLHMRNQALPVVPRAPSQINRQSSTHAPSVAVRHTAGKVMPLRVLRVVESGQPRCCTGRMVISGRMADVCAELDRLVEREAALH
jgi:hypothetical protein